MLFLAGHAGLRRFGSGRLVHALFYLPFHVGLGIVKLTDTLAQSPHEFRDFPPTKQYEHSQDDQDPFGSARHVK